MPRADTAVRAERDAYVLRLFLAGLTYREIGRHPSVRLSAKGVGDVLHRQLAQADPRYNDLGQYAAAVFIERTEMMIKSAWAQAMQGDLKAITAVARVLQQQARFYGLGSDAKRRGASKTVSDLQVGELLVTNNYDDDDDWELPANGFEKDKLISELRAQGCTLKAIGKAVGMSISGVSRALVRIDEGRPGRDQRAT